MDIGVEQCQLDLVHRNRGHWEWYWNYRNYNRMLHGVLSLLEPYEVKVSSTVLRGERDSNVPCLPDTKKWKSCWRWFYFFHFFAT